MARPDAVQPWIVASVRRGVAWQVANIVAAMALAGSTDRRRPRQATLTLIIAWLLCYFNGHALAHWAVGRAVGIKFVGFGLHGTTNPRWYPPGVRWVFRHLPLWSARTDVASRRAASSGARTAMYLAGPCATIATSLGLPLWGLVRGVPGAGALLRFAIVWMCGMLVGELAPHSDLRRAWRTFRG